MNKIIIIGGGPSGMMAAIKASENKNNSVTIIESNEKLGKKLFITGKGRCNLTNDKDISEFIEFIPGNPYFLYSSLYSFTNKDLMDFFVSKGIPLKVERGGRVFPESDKSSDILKILQKEIKNNDINVMLNSKVDKLIVKNNRIHKVLLTNGNEVKGDKFLIATGGRSYSQTGSTGDGYKWAKQCGHTLENIVPSLIPIELEDEWVKDLQGLSLKNVDFTVVDKKTNKKVFTEFGEMLFTHYGVSGPIVLKASRFINDKSSYKCIINLKP